MAWKAAVVHARAALSRMPARNSALAATLTVAVASFVHVCISWRRRLLAVRDERASAHIKFGNIAARGDKLEMALKHYALAAKLRPRSAAARYNAASICQRLKRFEDAVGHYEAALALRADFVEAASNLAVALLNCRRPAEAVDWCRTALRLEAAKGGFNREAFHHLNVALRLTGERELAVAETWAQIAALIGATGDSEPSIVRLPPAPALATGKPPPVTVVCVKWGEKYDAEYTNKLHRAVRRWLPEAAKFVCFTDDAEGLEAGVEARPLPVRDDWEGWWFKAYLFSREAQLSGRVLYLDLDTVIVGPLSPLLAYTGAFATLAAAYFQAEEGVADGFNSSAMLWDAGGGGLFASRASPLAPLHDALSPSVFRCLMRWDHWVEMVAPGAHVLQELFPGLFVDFRGDCKDGPPAGAAVVCFPRYPKPHEASAEWIDANWR